RSQSGKCSADIGCGHSSCLGPPRSWWALRSRGEGAGSDPDRATEQRALRMADAAAQWLLLDRGVHHVAQHAAVVHALLGRLHHEDDEHVLLGVDPEVSAAGAAPVVVASRAGIGGDTILSADCEAQAEAV